MHYSKDRILTTHTGSLPRPLSLLRLYGKRIRGEAVEEAEITRAGYEAMRKVVQGQLDCGIDIINNGEQQREGFFLYVERRMSGFGGRWKRFARGDYLAYPLLKEMMLRNTFEREGANGQEPPRVVGAVKYLDPALAGAESAEFKATLADMGAGGHAAFLTAPSPGIIAAACKNDFYPNDDAYFEALVTALRYEYEAIINAGFLLQVDCPDLALEHHRSFHGRPIAEFISFVERVVAAINAGLANIPREKVRMHVCWGNYEGPHDCDVPLEKIWPIVKKTNVGGFVFPFANARHAHEYKVLGQLPMRDDQVIVAGVIDTLTNFVEHPEVVADRIESVVKAVGDKTRVLAGTDCGFDSTAGQGRVAEDVAWAKLRSLVAGARMASERLY
jgi:5-methyltetrahydropteroyltriglutamate--homocysteine methyltransferase